MFLKFINIFSVLIFIIQNVGSTTETKKERKIKDKVVIITGGAQGIGFAIADNFLKNGAKAAIILDIDVTKGKQSENELNTKYGDQKAEFIECDVTKDLNKVARVIMKKYQYVDILINNAGIIDEDKPRELMTINTIATIEFSLKFNEYMRKDKCLGKGGTIINISSVVVHYIYPTDLTYKASKYAVSGFSLSLGQEYNYKKTGVRVLTICPGVTTTRISQQFLELVRKNLITPAVAEGYQFIKTQSADFIGQSIIKLFKTADTGTSWDVANGEPPFESTKTIKVIKMD